ncbi:hypothetical protein ACWT_2734 [Actinoplanes sp. SE50]|uniref:maleylpyruvate isomerase N-terminal domain-containing protein n=1 Tax=unclassified Actinoplanes TaxID=2626549 RepID=UPI00023EC945|nr:MULTISPECIES: maleylpyruvate isomerase N-terminal domain-containing protein [unclassified Actinoplanes]AEV83707.1 hypothetical protein ACPL_2812 [Actinoplanes sp. SE50/110]ATO82149.1 hypothetical protein ACWT_2734 [Actinoplanes sp. SE50]SLL99556.1 hypothetical protein ACSP50_2787 [Actinoplanes sp. SE50/110]
MNADDVDAAVQELQDTLAPYAYGPAWSTRAGDLDWTCRQTAVHIAHDLVAYAAQLAGRADNGYLPLDLRVDPGATPGEVLRVIAAAAGLLSAQLRAASPDDRAWHWGPADPSGFAALGVNEILIHTYDVAGGLGVAWRPPAALCAAVLSRLFPGHPDGDPVAALLWCTGRIALPGRPRRTSWVLRAAVD